MKGYLKIKSAPTEVNAQKTQTPSVAQQILREMGLNTLT